MESIFRMLKLTKRAPSVFWSFSIAQLGLSTEWVCSSANKFSDTGQKKIAQTIDYQQFMRLFYL